MWLMNAPRILKVGAHGTGRVECCVHVGVTRVVDGTRSFCPVADFLPAGSAGCSEGR